MVDKKLLKILVCPKCKKKLEYIKKEEGLWCKKCKLLYKIEDGIPNMLIEEAIPYNKKR